MSIKPNTPMGYRMLGRSGIRVSEICLGTMMFGGQIGRASCRERVLQVV